MQKYWSDVSFEINRNVVINKENSLFEEAKKINNNYRYLHLGCGSRILDGFENVDKYFEDPRVVNYDIFKLPHLDETVDLIYCSHVLEHLPIRHAKLAVKEWSRVLKKEAKLYLAIPDLEIIFNKLQDPSASDEFYEWMKYTLFGFQTNPANRNPSILDYPVDIGQFHTCGFTKKTITKELEKNNFKIKSIFNFDGWGTPSIWVEAVV